MRSMQGKLTEAIEQAATRGAAAVAAGAGFEVASSFRSSNVGTFYAMLGLRTLLEVHVDFQDTYCGVRLSGVGAENIVSQGGVEDYGCKVEVRGGAECPRWFHLDYSDEARLQGMLDAVEHAVRSSL